CLAYRPDGRQLAVGEGMDLILLAAQTGEIVQRRTGHNGPVQCVAFSPDGKQLASGAGSMEGGTVGAMMTNAQKRNKGEIKLWDAAGKEGVALEGPLGWPHCLKFSPDGRYVAAGFEDQKIKVWEATSGKLVVVLPGDTGPVRAMAFSPDGKRLASVS